MRRILLGVGVFIVLGPAVFGFAQAMVETLWYSSWANFGLTFILATCMGYVFGFPLAIGLGAIVNSLPRSGFYPKILLAAFSFGFLWCAIIAHEQTVEALRGSPSALADWLVGTTLMALCCTVASAVCAACVQYWRPR